LHRATRDLGADVPSEDVPQPLPFAQPFDHLVETGLEQSDLTGLVRDEVRVEIAAGDPFESAPDAFERFRDRLSGDDDRGEADDDDGDASPQEGRPGYGASLWLEEVDVHREEHGRRAAEE